VASKKVSWLNNEPPELLRSGDKIFVVYDGRVTESMIHGVPVDIIWNKKEPVLVWKGWYDISLFLGGEGVPLTWCRAKYIFTSKEEAEKAAYWWKVEVSEEEWLLAIGDRKIKSPEAGNIDDGCELLIGEIGDGTSKIRNWLMKAKERGGLMEIDRQHVQELIDGCWTYPEALDNADSKLGLVLKQLGLTWQQKAD
jgi:hypothetical protein